MILAIESATPRGSVALVFPDGTPAGEERLPEGRQASETFLAAVDRLLPSRGAGALTHVAVSAGPGSFTGLRVGLAAAKGFCLGLHLPLVPVPTLHALALRFAAPGVPVCPVLDARKNEVYAALFRWEGGECVRVLPDAALSPEDLPGRLPAGPVLFCGDGTIPYGPLLRERLGERALFPRPEDVHPRAAAVGALAARLVREGRAADPRDVVPAYVRLPEAERSASRGDRGGRVELTIPFPLLNLSDTPVPEATMGESTEAKIAALAEKDPAFKALVQEHRTLDEKLKELDRKVYLSPDEEMERKRLAKLKLAKKDRIARILAGP